MKNKGFTLVELAIVMMIIGLLIGGILKGAEMAHNARVKGVIKEVNSFNAAVMGFMDKYSGVMPGDMATAKNRIPNCNSDPICYNGNGNSIVGNRANIWVGGQHAMNTENTQFWKHLLLSDFISGISGGPTISWGESHPASRMAGGYTVIHSAFAANGNGGAAGQASPDGLHLRLQANPTTNMTESANGMGGNVNHPGDMPVSPSEAWQIDKIMDDGMPNTGYVRSYVHGNPSDIGCENAYDAQDKSKDCAMAFRMLGNK